MELVRDIQEIFNKTNEIKKKCTVFTNFFLNKKKITELIKKKKLFKIFDESNLIFLKKNKIYYNLYFFSNNHKKLSNILKKLKIGNYICDLILLNKNYKNFYKPFLNNKFKKYRNLIRLIKKKNINKKYLITDVKYAKSSDAKIILLNLEKNFDIYSDQIPEKYQNIGHGSKLMNFFLNKYCKSKRVILWVDKTNSVVIRKYYHFGFVKDKISDQIFLKKINNSFY